MKQLFISLVTIVFSLSSFALDDLVGDWCMSHDDFKTEMKITKSGMDINVTQMLIGNESGEVHGHYEGFISVGAGRLGQYMESQLHPNAEMAFWGYFDYRVTSRSGKKTLIINDLDSGHSEQYTECTITLAETQAQRLDRENSFY